MADILNSSFLERRLPTSWKKADITPLPKTSLVSDVNKHLRPISLTSILSKVVEEFVVDGYIKPAVLAKIDQNQYGTVPNSSTVHSLISMLHNWYKNTDGNGSTVHVVLFDHEEPQEVIFLHGIWRHIKEFGIEGQIPRISSPVKLEERC